MVRERQLSNEIIRKAKAHKKRKKKEEEEEEEEEEDWGLSDTR
jgi:hypothetical protein